MGRQTTGQLGTLGDYKKKVLFDMMGAHSYYFECAEDEREAEFWSRVANDFDTNISSKPDHTENARNASNIQIPAFRKKLGEATFC